MQTPDKYKFQRNFLATVLAIFSILFNPGSGLAYDPSDIVLGTNYNNIGYLRYLHIENEFDSVTVNYLFGETRIISGRSKLLVPIINRFNEEYYLKGTNDPGIDYILLSKSGTNNFKYKANSYIKFLRKIYLSAHKELKTVFDTADANSAEFNLTIYDSNWIIPKNSIKDRTEFLVELVKVNDPTSIYVIDSVGVDENKDEIVAPRYGWKPDKVSHIRKLPNEFADQDVYIRIKPIRYGRTDKSLAMRIVPNWISKSLLIENDKRLFTKISKEELIEKSLSKFFNESILYCDSVKSLTGSLPEKLPLIDVLTCEQKEILEKMFFDVKIVHNDTVLAEKNESGGDSPNIYLSEDSHQKLSVSQVNCIPFDKILLLNIQCKVGLPESSIKLYDYQYTLLKEIWSGDLQPGDNSISINNLDIPRGVYLVQISHLPMKTTISAIIKR